MKITIDKQVIEQALEALERSLAPRQFDPGAHKTITALRSALAESVEQEPVGWYLKGYLYRTMQRHLADYSIIAGQMPLYLHPAPAVPEVEKYREALEMASDALNVSRLQVPPSYRAMIKEALAKIEEVLNK